MQHFLNKILFFFIIVGLIDFGIGQIGEYFLRHAKGGSTRGLNDLVMNDEHEVLILGSSRAHHHYDTPFLSDTLDIDIYNAGYDGNGVILSDGILQMVLNRYHPKFVVFDVEPTFDIYHYEGDNNHIRYISHLLPYYKEEGISEIIKDVSMNEWRKAHSGMIRYNTKILSMAIDNLINRIVDNKGYAPLGGAMTKEPSMDCPEKQDCHDMVDTFKLKYIQNLISLCQSNNIPLILVGSPKYGQKTSEALRPVIEIASQNNIQFLDYYAEPSFMEHKEWFKESMHLNAEGARIFSRMLARDLFDIIEQYNGA